MPSHLNVLFLFASLFCFSVVISDTIFVYPQPSGSASTLAVGAEDTIRLQWTTTEIPARVSPWLWCQLDNYLTAGCGEQFTLENTWACDFKMNFDYLIYSTPQNKGGRTTCMFQLRILPNAGTGPMPGSPIANSTFLQVNANGGGITYSANTTMPYQAPVVPETTSLSSIHTLLSSSTSRYGNASSTKSQPTSSLGPFVTSSPTNLPKRPIGIGLGLGLGIGVPLTLGVISFSAFFALRRRQRRRYDGGRPSETRTDIFKKPELDAQDTATVVQYEPRQLHHSIDAPYEIEGDIPQVRELGDDMLREFNSVDNWRLYVQELCNEDEIRQMVTELDGHCIAVECLVELRNEGTTRQFL